MNLTDWRCRRCNRKLGGICGGKVHLQFSRGHEYIAHLPATATCRGCGALNEHLLPAPDRIAERPSPSPTLN